MERIIYHGSSNLIKHPVYGKGKPYNDYGLGFYCTENPDLAKEWAVNESQDGYLNSYKIDDTDQERQKNISTRTFPLLMKNTM